VHGNKRIGGVKNMSVHGERRESEGYMHSKRSGCENKSAHVRVNAHKGIL
jgi:hypothetical protein